MFTGDLMTLNANITNPDGNTDAEYTYVWSQVTGRTTTLSSTTAAHPTYTLPSSGANPTTAACTSGTGATSPTSANCPRFQVIVTKINTGKVSAAAALAAHGSSLPARPVANAGPDQTNDIGLPTAQLDGTGSTQTQGHTLSYLWSQTAGPAVTLSSNTSAQPTFDAPSTPTSYTFSLVVTDTQSPISGSGANGNTSLANTVDVVYKFQSPVISAGDDQSVHTGQVTLHGSASQLNGHALTYLWEQTGGPPVSLSDPTVLEPTFTAPTNGPVDLDFTLTVTDTENANVGLATTTDSTTVHVTNGTPVANAGPDQEVTANELVTLDGTGSSDPDDDTLTYLWEQTAGTTVTLDDPTAAQPTFFAPADGSSTVFKLTVSDGHGLSSTDLVVVGNGNNDPTADAGPDQNKVVSTLVTLDGSGSEDPDPNQPLTYTWAQTGGTPVTLSDTHGVHPTFTAPSLVTTLTFDLTVDDGFGGTDTDSVTINVTNAIPVANAGVDQTKVVSTLVTLDGSGSSDADPGQTATLTYLWEQLSGTSVTLSSTTAQKPTFTAPVLASTLEFKVTVNDGHAGTSSDTVIIDVINHAPTANAGPDQGPKNPGQLVTLNGLGSSDPDGHTLTYTWLQTGGLAVSLSNTHVAQPQFITPTGPSLLTFQLTVDDGHGGSATDSVDVVLTGTPGLDMRAELSGGVATGQKNIDFTMTVYNVGTVTRTITQSDLKATVSLNGTPVPASQISLPSPSASLAAGKSKEFTINWTTPTAVPVGTALHVETCINVVGDYFPANNCSAVDQTNGPTSFTVSPVIGDILRTQTSNPFTTTVKNTGPSTVSVPASALSMEIRVNGGAPTIVAGSGATTNLQSGKSTGAFSFTWSHVVLHADDLVTTKACISVAGQAGPQCTTIAVIVK